MGKILSYPANSNPSSTFSFIGADPDAPTVTQIVSTGTLGPWTNVRRYGATGNGTTDDTTAIQDAVNAVVSAGAGVVYFPAGSYKVTSTITCEVPDMGTVIFAGDGEFASVIMSYVTGDCIRMYDPTPWTGSQGQGSGSGIRSIGIDGTNAGASSNGLHVGDIVALTIRDVRVQNFTGTGSVGLCLDNTNTWTEECDIRAVLNNCTQHAVLTVTTGYNSFGYSNIDLTVLAGSNQQDALALLDGAVLYHSHLRLRGNMEAGSTSTTAAVLRMEGAAPGTSPDSGATVTLLTSHLDIQMECSAGTYAPMTIYMDTTNYAYAQSNYGILAFDNGGGSFANASYNNDQFLYSGVIKGDTSIGAVDGYWQNINIPVIYNANSGFIDSTAGIAYLYPEQADMNTITLSSDVTIALAESGVYQPPAGAQRFTVFIQQAASGGPYTVTWPKPASPSITSPAVYWAGGTAPTMSTGASALDMYQLTTTDGIHWYGTATQNLE